VRNYAVEAGLCQPRRYKKPKGHNKHKRVMSPPDEWYPAVMPYLSVKLRALVVLLSTHGLRASEALQRTPDDLDTKGRTWVMRLNDYDKAGDRVQIELADHVIEAIDTIPNWRAQKWLFGTSSVSNVNRDIRRACAKAGVEAYGTHALGRHKAARNFLRAGGSLKGLQDAYRWKDPRMPMQHYGHEEQSEIQKRVHQVGHAFWDDVEAHARTDPAAENEASEERDGEEAKAKDTG
jgi:integrase